MTGISDSEFGSATILPSSPPNLSNGDFAIINGTTGTATVPEPAYVWLLGTCLVASMGFRHPALRRKVRTMFSTASRRVVLSIALLLGLVLILPASSWAQVHLNVATSPSSGVAGVSNVNITGSSFPSGTITPANVMVSWAGPSCGDVPATSVPANSVITILGSVRRINVNIPAGLATGTWFVKVSDSAGGDANFSSSNCSQVSVTHSNPTLSACVPTSSLGIIAPATGPASVRALVPNGSWGGGNTGVQVVQLETGGGPIVAPASSGARIGGHAECG
jgi:hypothetical protein